MFIAAFFGVSYILSTHLLYCQTLEIKNSYEKCGLRNFQKSDNYQEFVFYN
jgi:hypothetical protein